MHHHLLLISILVFLAIVLMAVTQSVTPAPVGSLNTINLSPEPYENK